MTDAVTYYRRENARLTKQVEDWRRTAHQLQTENTELRAAIRQHRDRHTYPEDGVWSCCADDTDLWRTVGSDE